MQRHRLAAARFTGGTTDPRILAASIDREFRMKPWQQAQTAELLVQILTSRFGGAPLRSPEANAVDGKRSRRTRDRSIFPICGARLAKSTVPAIPAIARPARPADSWHAPIRWHWMRQAQGPQHRQGRVERGRRPLERGVQQQPPRRGLARGSGWIHSPRRCRCDRQRTDSPPAVPTRVARSHQARGATRA